MRRPRLGIASGGGYEVNEERPRLLAAGAICDATDDATDHGAGLLLRERKGCCH